MQSTIPFNRPKVITRFSLSSRSGFHLDLEDAPAAVTVTPNSGDVLLHEGVGSARLEHVAVSGSSVVGFSLGRIEGVVQLILRFRRGSRTQEHVLGIPDDLESAEAWVQRVGALYKNIDEELQRRSA